MRRELIIAATRGNTPRRHSGLRPGWRDWKPPRNGTDLAIWHERRARRLGRARRRSSGRNRAGDTRIEPGTTRHVGIGIDDLLGRGRRRLEQCDRTFRRWWRFPGMSPTTTGETNSASASACNQASGAGSAGTLQSTTSSPGGNGAARNRHDSVGSTNSVVPVSVRRRVH